MKYSRYPNYKDSGVEWFNEVPEHWKALPARSIVSNLMDKNENAKDQRYLSLMANVGVIRYEDKGDVGNKKPDDLSKCKIVKKGNLVINSMNYSIGSYGMSSYDGVCSPVYVVLDINEDKLYPAFGLRLFENKAYQRYVASFGNGILAHRSAIGWDEIKGSYMPLPPLHEQQTIANYLNKATAKIDTLIEKQTKLIELLREKRQAVISTAVTRGLDSTVAMKDSGVEWLGEIPEHWVKTSFKRIGFIRYGIGEPPKYKTSGVALIRATNVKSGFIIRKGLVFVDPKDIPSQRIIWLKIGDIVVVRSGALTGDSAIITSEYNNTIAGFDMVFRINKAVPMFIQYTLLSHYIKNNQIDQEKMRAAQPHLNAEELGSCIFVMPPTKEQEDIVIYLNNKTSKIDNLITKATKAIDLLKEKRIALISSAVTGKIDVREIA